MEDHAPSITYDFEARRLKCGDFHGWKEMANDSASMGEENATLAEEPGFDGIDPALLED
jgi:hypothetical protein